MEFKNPTVSSKYSMVGDTDIQVDLPGRNRYKGPLSEVSDPDIIAGMIKRKSNLVTEKSPGKNPEPAAKAAPAVTGK